MYYKGTHQFHVYNRMDKLNYYIKVKGQSQYSGSQRKQIGINAMSSWKMVFYHIGYHSVSCNVHITNARLFYKINELRYDVKVKGQGHKIT
jgi:hypothetical protein